MISRISQISPIGTRGSYLSVPLFLKYALSVLSIVLPLVSNSAIIASGISTAGVDSKAKDFGPTPSASQIGGKNVGSAGYWFPNVFNGPQSDAGIDTHGQPVDQNALSSLPSWLSVQFASSPPATYSFSPTATSSGGPLFNAFIFPTGATEVSGQLVDNINASSQQQSTIIDHWNFGPGVPGSFYLTLVVDSIGKNTQGNPSALPDGPNDVNQITATVYAADNSSNSATFSGNAIVAPNGKADAYSFLLTGVQPGGHFSVALGTAGNAAGTADVALGGVLFTSAVPEPSSAIALFIACITIGCWQRASRRPLRITTTP